MNTIEYLDDLKREYGLTSDYQLSKKLGESRGRISAYRVGRSTFDDDMAIKVAQLLDLPPGVVLADMAAERAKRTETKKAWQDIAQHFRATAASLTLLFIGSMLFSPSPTLACNGQNELPKNVYYVKRRNQLDWLFELFDLLLFPV